MGVTADGIAMAVVRTDAHGHTRFADAFIPFVAGGEPLRVTAPRAASSICFREAPAGHDNGPGPAPGRQLVLVTAGMLEVTAGDGEARALGAGDVLEIGDAHGDGLRSRALGTAPLRCAVVSLDGATDPDGGEPVAPAAPGRTIRYPRNLSGPDGRSFTRWEHIACTRTVPEGVETDAIGLRALQFVLAPGSLDYAWHPAPQRQIVLVLTGGLETEMGDGTRARVEAGGFLIGEDTTGGGHRTRSLDGRPRLSVFAHLA